MAAMNDSSLETLLRQMRPAPLPADVCAHLQDEPPKYRAPLIKRPLLLGLLSAAALLLLCLLWPGTPASAPVITLHQQESTLLRSKRIALEKHDQVWWEQCEQEWLDEEFTLCSNHPALVRFARTRHEVVWQPVDFQ
jgi:hypothetical protein